MGPSVKHSPLNSSLRNHTSCVISLKVLPLVDIWKSNRTSNGTGNSGLPYFIAINELMTHMIQFPLAPQDKSRPRQLGWPFLYRLVLQNPSFNIMQRVTATRLVFLDYNHL